MSQEASHFSAYPLALLNATIRGKKMPLAPADLRVRNIGSKPELNQKLEAYGSLDTTDPQA